MRKTGLYKYVSDLQFISQRADKYVHGTTPATMFDPDPEPTPAPTPVEPTPIAPAPVEPTPVVPAPSPSPPPVPG